jgi:proline dehydrogenase
MEYDVNYHEFWDKSAETILAALSTELLTIEQLQWAMAERQRKRPAIGELALKGRRLTMSQVFRILEEQAIKGEMFGTIAIRKEYLEQSDLSELLHEQLTATPSLIDILLSINLISTSDAQRLAEQVREDIRQHCHIEQLASLA